MCPLKGLGDSSTTGKSESLLGDLDDIFAASSASSGSVSSICVFFLINISSVCKCIGIC